jgi:hypothetical protein
MHEKHAPVMTATKLSGERKPQLILHPADNIEAKWPCIVESFDDDFRGLTEASVAVHLWKYI